jgi:hypothetical protein
MPRLISQWLIDQYSAGPSTTRTSQVQRVHQAIRSALGTAQFDTFLQGSYRNNTAIADINDVDIVALFKRSGTLTASEWENLFSHIAGRVRAAGLGGTASLGDKCVKFSGTLKADVVPAMYGTFSGADPVLIWSRRQRQSRQNFPRTHYDNGVLRNALTPSYKPTVRLMKRWARQFGRAATTMPSFYLECAVHGVSTTKFDSYLPLSFLQVGREICSWNPRTKILKSVAGDKDVLVTHEWHPQNFNEFKALLEKDLTFVVSAINAATASEANRWWKLAFGEH